MNQLVLNISKIDKRDLDIVGKYAVELGELCRIGVPIPEGFVVTANCFREFLAENKFDLASAEKQLMHSHISKDISSQINNAYRELVGSFKESSVILTLSSSDFKNTHFEVNGDANLIHKIKEIWTSQFSKISLLENGINDYSDLHKLDISVIVQKKIKNDKSGRVFTEDPITSDKTKIVIEQDKNVSHYLLSKHNLDIKFKGHLTKSKNSHKVSDFEAHELAILGKKIERHFYFPQEIKFAISKNKVYILETKPMTNISSQPVSYAVLPRIPGRSKINKSILLKGVPNFPGIATGPVRVYRNFKAIRNVISSEILVVPRVEANLFPIIKRARGLITESIFLTNHDKMIYRKIVGKPIIQGAKNATLVLRSGDVVTLNGEKGEIYRGGL